MSLHVSPGTDETREREPMIIEGHEVYVHGWYKVCYSPRRSRGG